MDEEKRKSLQEKFWAVLSEYFGYSQGNIIQAAKKTADQLEVLNPNLEKISKTLKEETQRFISAANALANSQSRQQNVLIGANCVLVMVTVFNMFLAQKANEIQTQNQQLEAQSKIEYQNIILENLAEEIEINLDLTRTIMNFTPTEDYKISPIGRFPTFHLEKVRELRVSKDLRRGAIDLLSNLQQANDYRDLLADKDYANSFDENLMRFKEFLKGTEKIAGAERRLVVFQNQLQSLEPRDT